MTAHLKSPDGTVEQVECAVVSVWEQSGVIALMQPQPKEVGELYVYQCFSANAWIRMRSIDADNTEIELV